MDVPDASDEAVLERLGARVLLLDSAGRVLLLRGNDPAAPGSPYWFTVGGGKDAGESDREAAVREVFEETGLRIDPAELRGPVHHEVAEFPFAGRRYRQRQVFFAYRVDLDAAWTPDTAGFEQVERDSIDSWRWWSSAELRATAEPWYPAELPDLLDEMGAARAP